MATYLLLAFSIVLGIIGLVAKTKKDDKPGYFNKLTPFGIAVLFLLLCTFITNIWLEKDKRRKAYEQKQLNILKEQKDSLQFIIDSSNQAYTINALRLQNNLNRQQLADDSIRFGVTLKKFEQQLNRQNLTLANTSEQLKMQNSTLVQLHRSSTLLDKVVIYFGLEYSFNDKEISEFAESIKARAEASAREYYKKGNYGSNGMNSRFWVRDTAINANIQFVFVDSAILLEQVSLSPNSILMPNRTFDYFSPWYPLASMEYTIDFYTRPTQKFPQLGFALSANNAKERMSNSEIEYNPIGVKPSGISLIVSYTSRTLEQLVYSESIGRTWDDGTIISVMDLKPTQLVIKRTEGATDGKLFGESARFKFFNILWGNNLSKSITLRLAGLKWIKDPPPFRKIVYDFDGSESNMFLK